VRQPAIVLENLVAMMQKLPGIRVEKRKRLSVLRSRTSQKRKLTFRSPLSVADIKSKSRRGKNEAKALDTWESTITSESRFEVRGADRLEEIDAALKAVVCLRAS
jgi:hypothetical protein